MAQENDLGRSKPSEPVFVSQMAVADTLNQGLEHLVATGDVSPIQPLKDIAMAINPGRDRTKSGVSYLGEWVNFLNSFEDRTSLWSVLNLLQTVEHRYALLLSPDAGGYDKAKHQVTTAYIGGKSFDNLREEAGLSENEASVVKAMFPSITS